MLLAKGGGGSAANYIEDVFSTWLYTGNGSTQTITNGIDLSGKGGLVWGKPRNQLSNHFWVDTARGANNWIQSNTINAQEARATVSAFSSNGFTVNAAGGYTNDSGINYASWTFREQPKFFDIVTYTGDGTNNRNIAHSLNSVPGCIMVKCTSGTGDWAVYHRSAGGQVLVLNRDLNAGVVFTPGNFGNGSGTMVIPTSSVFTVGGSGTNANGTTYVAYLFAHDAGGFGLSGMDNVISCGSYTGNGSITAGPTVTLGYEPQWLMVKNASGTSNWQIIDSMRGMSVNSSEPTLQANLADSESSTDYISPTATGFRVTTSNSEVNTSGSNYIYIAIRRGPMKVPTTGTSVFGVTGRYGTDAATTVTGGIGVTDLAIIRPVGGTSIWVWANRLTDNRFLASASTSSQFIDAAAIPSIPWDVMDGIQVGDGYDTNISTQYYINYLIKRAPRFMDVVCYTGTGAARTVEHNLAAVPELMIVKRRDGNSAWQVYSSALANTDYLVLNTTASNTNGITHWNSTTPTSSVFSLGAATEVNATSGVYVAYLFASCLGVSKVGSYTGTGAIQVIDCGFSAGARFVMIKRTNSPGGDWYVWDTARGIVTANDPRLSLNTSAAQVTTDDSIDPNASGFIVNQLAATDINVTSANYIYLAIA